MLVKFEGRSSDLSVRRASLGRNGRNNQNQSVLVGLEPEKAMLDLMSDILNIPRLHSHVHCAAKPAARWLHPHLPHQKLSRAAARPHVASASVWCHFMARQLLHDRTTLHSRGWCVRACYRYCLGFSPHRANGHDCWLPTVEVTDHLFPLQAHALDSLFTDGAHSLICAAGNGSDSRIRRLQLSRKQLAYDKLMAVS